MGTAAAHDPDTARPSPASRRVAAAAVGVIADHGLEGLSVRNVAARLGMSGGAVQHHYPTRAALLRAAMESVVDRLEVRLERLLEWPATSSVRELLVAALEEALPLDAERRAEGTVWVALSAAAAHHEDLRDLHARYLDAFVHELAPLLGASEAEVGPQELGRAQVLAAAVDGLTLQGITRNLSDDTLRRALGRAVDQALADVGGTGGGPGSRSPAG